MYVINQHLSGKQDSNSCKWLWLGRARLSVDQPAMCLNCVESPFVKVRKRWGLVVLLFFSEWSGGNGQRREIGVLIKKWLRPFSNPSWLVGFVEDWISSASPVLSIPHFHAPDTSMLCVVLVLFRNEQFSQLKAKRSGVRLPALCSVIADGAPWDVVTSVFGFWAPWLPVALPMCLSLSPAFSHRVPLMVAGSPQHGSPSPSPALCRLFSQRPGSDPARLPPPATTFGHALGSDVHAPVHACPSPPDRMSSPHREFSTMGSCQDSGRLSFSRKLSWTSTCPAGIYSVCHLSFPPFPCPHHAHVHAHVHTHTLSHTHTHTPIFLWTHRFIYTLIHTLTLTDSCSQAHTPALNTVFHTHILSHSCSHRLTLIHAHSLIHSHTYTLTHSHTHAHSLTHVLMLSYTLFTQSLTFMFSHILLMLTRHIDAHIYSHSLTYSHAHSHSLMLMFTCSHSLTQFTDTLMLTPIHTHTLSHTCIHTHMHTHRHTHMHSHILSYTHTPSHTQADAPTGSHRLMFTYTLSHTPTLMLTLPQVHAHSPPRTHMPTYPSTPLISQVCTVSTASPMRVLSPLPMPGLRHAQGDLSALGA